MWCVSTRQYPIHTRTGAGCALYTMMFATPCPGPLPGPTTLPESLKAPEQYAELITCSLLTTELSWPPRGHVTPWAIMIDENTDKALMIEDLLHRLWLNTLLNRVTCHIRNRAENERTERLKPNCLSVVPRTGGSCKGREVVCRLQQDGQPSPESLCTSCSIPPLFVYRNGLHLRLNPRVLLFIFSHEYWNVSFLTFKNHPLSIHSKKCISLCTNQF